MARRSYLLDIEAKIQSLWHEFSVNESNVPLDELKPKYYFYFPYPYMNGKLHIGHGFSASKAEFQARFQALIGKQVLWPIGFHCTGMPIAACADKIKLELLNNGSNANIDKESQPNDNNKVDTNTDDSNSDVLKYSSKKSKAASKAASEMTQIEIMVKMGIDRSIVHKFADADYWLTYFPPLAIQDLKRLGFAVDWRRSFITTSRNPYYDSFVRWQFHNLLRSDKLLFGCRPSIISTKTLQPCADHDRSEGEGVVPQEYTLVKLKLLTQLDLSSLLSKEYSCFFNKLKNLPVYMLAATLRPETLYGQTNCYVLPDGEYYAMVGFNKPKMEFSQNGILECVYDVEKAVDTADAIYISGSHASYNMAYQGIVPLKHIENGSKPHFLFTLKGQDLIGFKFEAPASMQNPLYILPMTTISMTKGTGIVTSVPSDSPDDYLMYKEIRNKAQYYKDKFGVLPEYLSVDIIPIIEIPGMSDRSAVTECERLGITSIKDRNVVDPIKGVLYKRGYYEGVMLVGDYKGKIVKDVKDKIKDDLISSGGGLLYREPEKTVVSRGGDVCVVALCNQWYIKYGDESWKESLTQIINSDKFVCKNESTFNQVKNVINWLDHWACSRSYGLGSYVSLTNDDNYNVLIESLSDSPIFMSYFTIVQYLQGDMYGSKPGLFNVPAEYINNEVLDYLFDITDKVPETPIDKDLLLKARNEFKYWYPCDLGVSGKDLLFNHLTMSLFIHQAIWQDRYFPRSYFCNGHILINSEKMSKSKGNFLTLEDCINTYTADGTRIAIADAGDSMDDANFSCDTANSGLLKLYTLIQLCKELVESTEYRDGGAIGFDNGFINNLKILSNKAKEAYASFCYRDALKYSFYEMISLIQQYKLHTKTYLMNKQYVNQYLDTLAKILSPICPHACEYIWRFILNNDSFLLHQEWPNYDNIDWDMYRRFLLLDRSIDNFRRAKEKAIAQLIKKKSPVKNYNKGEISVATKYTALQSEVLNVLSSLHLKGVDLNTNLSSHLMDNHFIKNLSDSDKKSALQFANYIVKEELPVRSDNNISLEFGYDELSFLQEQFNYIKESLQLEELIIQHCDDGNCIPGKPTIKYSN